VADSRTRGHGAPAWSGDGPARIIVAMLPANAITIRTATETDDEALRQLAILDTRRPLGGHILVAEEDGAVTAALSLDERRAIADPFEPSAAALELLRARARALRAQGFRPSLRERVLAPLRALRRGRALPSLSA
jgi:hypothetical protein